MSTGVCASVVIETEQCWHTGEVMFFLSLPSLCLLSGQCCLKQSWHSLAISWCTVYVMIFLLQHSLLVHGQSHKIKYHNIGDHMVQMLQQYCNDDYLTQRWHPRGFDQESDKIFPLLIPQWWHSNTPAAQWISSVCGLNNSSGWTRIRNQVGHIEKRWEITYKRQF